MIVFDSLIFRLLARSPESPDRQRSALPTSTFTWRPGQSGRTYPVLGCTDRGLLVGQRVSCVARWPCAEHLLVGRSSGTLRYLNSKRGVVRSSSSPAIAGARTTGQAPEAKSVSLTSEFMNRALRREGSQPWGGGKKTSSQSPLRKMVRP